MFPGAGAQVYRNEAGEPLGWDYPSDEPEYLDPYEYDQRFGARDAAAEEAWEAITEQDDDDLLAQHSYEDEPWKRDAIHDEMADRHLEGDPTNCEACETLARRRLVEFLAGEVT